MIKTTPQTLLQVPSFLDWETIDWLGDLGNYSFLLYKVIVIRLKDPQNIELSFEHKITPKALLQVTTYTDNETILVLGDGDFSFGRGLVQHRKSGSKLVITSFDSRSEVVRKYGEKVCCLCCLQVCFFFLKIK